MLIDHLGVIFNKPQEKQSIQHPNSSHFFMYYVIILQYYENKNIFSSKLLGKREKIDTKFLFILKFHQNSYSCRSASIQLAQSVCTVNSMIHNNRIVRDYNCPIIAACTLLLSPCLHTLVFEQVVD